MQFLAYLTDRFGYDAIVARLTTAQLIGATPLAELPESVRANQDQHDAFIGGLLASQGIQNTDIQVLMPGDTLIADVVDAEGVPCFLVTLPEGEHLQVIDGATRLRAMLPLNPESEFTVIASINGEMPGTPGFLAIEEEVAYYINHLD